MSFVDAIVKTATADLSKLTAKSGTGAAAADASALLTRTGPPTGQNVKDTAPTFAGTVAKWFSTISSNPALASASPTLVLANGVNTAAPSVQKAASSIGSSITGFFSNLKWLLVLGLIVALLFVALPYAAPLLSARKGS